MNRFFYIFASLSSDAAKKPTVKPPVMAPTGPPKKPPVVAPAANPLTNDRIVYNRYIKNITSCIK